MQPNAIMHLHILKLASAAHAAPADAAEDCGVESYDLSHRVRFEYRAESEGRTEAGHQEEDDKHDNTRHN